MKGYPGTSSKVSHICKGCKKEFFDLLSKHRVFCSKSCCGRASGVIHNKPHTLESKMKMSAKRKGMNSPWKGKTPTLETRIKISAGRRGLTIKEWDGFAKPKDVLEREKFRRNIQKQVFERDNYTCHMCGIRGVSLQVDHIQPWAEYVELRFDIDNCRTLCMKCHYKVTFGKEKPLNIKSWGHNLKHKLFAVTGGN